MAKKYSLCPLSRGRGPKGLSGLPTIFFAASVWFLFWFSERINSKFNNMNKKRFSFVIKFDLCLFASCTDVYNCDSTRFIIVYSRQNCILWNLNLEIRHYRKYFCGGQKRKEKIEHTIFFLPIQQTKDHVRQLDKWKK